MNLPQMQALVKEFESQIRAMGRQVLSEYNRRWKAIRENQPLADNGFDLCRIKAHAARIMAKENNITPDRLDVPWQIAEIAEGEQLSGDSQAAKSKLPDMPTFLFGKTADPTKALLWVFDWIAIPWDRIPQEEWPSMGAWSTYWQVSEMNSAERRKWIESVLRKTIRPAKAVADEAGRVASATASYGKIEKMIEDVITATSAKAAAGPEAKPDIQEASP